MNEAHNEQQPLNLPQEQYEPVISRSKDLDLLNQGVMLDVFDVYEHHEIKTCYGDIVSIVNALRDYSRLLEMVCDDWNLEGFHRATYEFHAKKLRKIAGKFQAGIGYDYDAAVEKCRKKQGKKQRDEDVGGEALTMGYLKSKREAEARNIKAAEEQTDRKRFIPGGRNTDSPQGENF